ncbi:nicotinate phosphoribosyltransferase, partial [Pseudomonas aeruginosa]
MAESACSERIVENLLDTDCYKLTIVEAVLHKEDTGGAQWEFCCRNQE